MRICKGARAELELIGTQEDFPSTELRSMQLFFCSAAILAVTVIYLFWKSYNDGLERRDKRIRERVTYLLWVMADLDNLPPTPSGFHGRLTSPSL